MGAAARLSEGGAELCAPATGACQGNRPWPEAGTRSGAKAEAARGKEEGSLSLVAIEVCVENADGLVATHGHEIRAAWARRHGQNDHPLGLGAGRRGGVGAKPS